jgi:hypothetical protein
VCCEPSATKEPVDYSHARTANNRRSISSDLEDRKLHPICFSCPQPLGDMLSLAQRLAKPLLGQASRELQQKRFLNIHEYQVGPRKLSRPQ